MFVPRAVNRKPTKPTVRKKPEANSSQIHPDRGLKSEGDLSSPSSSRNSESVSASASDARASSLSSSGRGDESPADSRQHRAGEAPGSTLEDPSTDLGIGPPGCPSENQDLEASVAADRLPDAVLKDDHRTPTPSSVCESSPRTGPRTSVRTPSHLSIDIAAIRKSVDRMKNLDRFPSTDQKRTISAEGDDEVEEEEDGEEGEVDDDAENEEEVEEVVSYSKNQRWPSGQDEPVCVMCGRYGAYICDQTEADVCSRECKAKNLARLGRGASSTPAAGASTEEKTEEPAAETDSKETEEPLGYIYREHDEVAELASEQVQEIRAQVDIFVEGVDIPRPIIEFAHLRAPKKMESNLSDVGYNTPTPVQMQVLPSALGWRDMMVCAQTSSGKTAAFLVPTILQIYNSMCFRDIREKGDGPLGLILTPSRELAMQIEDQSKQLMQGLPNMRTALVVGGLPMPSQLHRLKQDIQLVIATPGRILDVIGRQGVSLTGIKIVVIDEVDTMLYKGFQQQVMEVMGHLSSSHQTMLFSATIPPSIERVATSLLHNPIFVSVGKPNTPCVSVKQIVMWVEEPAKKKNLFAILQDPKHYRPPMVVFVDSKIGAGLLSLAIHKMCDIHAASLHGDRPQSERTETLRAFREGEYPVLVCTAVLGRGIDLPGVKMVVNFDMPSTVEEYIHQIGRTGRLGSKGTAITFINNGSKNLFLELVNTLKPLGVPLPPQLTQSAHLRYQQLDHRSRQEVWRRRGKAGRRDNDDDEGGETGRHGNASYFGYKRRKKEASIVGELLKKRKGKGPR